MANRISKTELHLVSKANAAGRIALKRDVTKGKRGGVYVTGQREWSAGMKLVALGFAQVVREDAKGLRGGHRQLMVLELTDAGRELAPARRRRRPVQNLGASTPVSVLFSHYDSKEDFFKELLEIPEIQEHLSNVRKAKNVGKGTVRTA